MEDNQKKNVELVRERKKKIEASSNEMERNIREKENFEKELEKANVLLNIKRDNINNLLIKPPKLNPPRGETSRKKIIKIP